MKITLLEQFIVDKIESYQEPTRKGTTRGEPIGLAKQKYYTALLCLQRIPIRNIAASGKVSYGVLRKWRTEDFFKREIERTEDEFVNLFYDHLWKRVMKDLDLFSEHISRSLSDVTNTPPPMLTFSEYSNITKYSLNLLQKIALKMDSQFNEKKVVEKIMMLFPEVGDMNKGVIKKNIESVYRIFKKQCLPVLELLMASLSSKGEMTKLRTRIQARCNQEEKHFLNHACGIIRNELTDDTTDDEQRKIAIAMTYFIQNKVIQVDMK